MTNRRRSERLAVSLPVVIKGARGAENTLTANVSAHGLAVFTDAQMSLRQYVELELKLPPDATPISVTAMVARMIQRLEDPAGITHPGVAFDFYLFDARGRTAWRAFLDRLRAQNGAADAEPPPVAAPPPPAPVQQQQSPAPQDPIGDGATFIIKPRDVGRLWSFFRGELGTGRVRIETPVLKPIGTPVEVLVIHPATQDEMSLAGRVVGASEHGRGRGPMLEIGLVDVGDAARQAFRRFITSGEPQDAGEHAVIAPAVRPVPPPDPPTEEASRAANGEAPPRRSFLPPPPPPPGTRTIDPVPRGSLPPPPPMVRRTIDPPPARPSLSASREMLLRDQAPTEEASRGAEPKPYAAAVEPVRPLEPQDLLAEPIRDSSISADSSPEILASFGSELHLREEPSEESLPLVYGVPNFGQPARSSELITAAKQGDSESDPDEATQEADKKDNASAPTQPKEAVFTAPEPAPPVPAPSTSQERSPFAAFFAEYEQERPEGPTDSAPARDPVKESTFEDDAETNRDSGPMPVVKKPEITKIAGDHLRPARGPRGMREEVSVIAHRSLSTEGSDPNLDREIALARARVVRAPNSVTACYQLGKLLLRRGGDESLDEATSQLERAVSLEPNHPGAHLAAAELAVKQGRFDAAADHLQRARRLGYRIDERLEKAVAEGRKSSGL